MRMLTQKQNLEVGTRVTLRRDVERFPHFIAKAGMSGTVVNDDEILMVKMDDHLPGAEEWDNEIMWADDEFDNIIGDLNIHGCFTLHPFNDEHVWAKDGREALTFDSVGSAAMAAKDIAEEYEQATGTSTWYAVHERNGLVGVAVISPDGWIYDTDGDHVLEQIGADGQWPDTIEPPVDEDEEAELDALAAAAYQAMQDPFNEVLRVAVSDQVGHTDWPGDVDPLSSIRMDEAITSILRQLIENGTPGR